MQFKCPNCDHQIRIKDDVTVDDEQTIDRLECPSCHSRFSLREDSTNSTFVPRAGIKIGRYELLEILGEGSFGVVYKAWDPTLSRHVALKTQRDRRVDGESARLFLKEARAGAAIRHPNVVAVHEIGTDEGRSFIVSDLIEGVSLAEYLKAKSFSQTESIRLMILILRAMQVFHDQGIVHRDLKPGNILLDRSNTPYITDFGLARLENPNEITVTQSGRIIGTVAYMPPEQARGETHNITNRSDIYSAGVILYELLAGQRPFKSHSSRTLIHSLLTEDVPPIRKIRKDVHRDVETICLVALEKDPARRYESAGQMADELQRYLDGKPILARRTPFYERMYRLIMRNKLVSACVLVTSAALVLAAVLIPGNDPMGTMAVIINTEPPADTLTFIRYNSMTRMPHESGLTREAQSGSQIRLPPGLYKVVGQTADGKYHEVWRTVPETVEAASADWPYPHRIWKKDGTDGVILPSFRLFSDSDVKAPMVQISEGEFDAGYDTRLGMPAATHHQLVKSFRVAVDEVSYGDLRTTLATPIDAAQPEAGSYLEWLNQRFGDRTAYPDTKPVSGYPRDVAILYCELAGGRLPSCIEYEYAATQRGTTAFPTGDTCVVADATQWNVPETGAATPDVSGGVIRNLFFGLAEITDSNAFHYGLLYPNAFTPKPAIPVPDLPFEICELRGAPAEWVFGPESKEPLSPKTRISLTLPVLVEDSKIEQSLSKIGWRLYRTSN